jgi:hypothetical protein
VSIAVKFARWLLVVASSSCRMTLRTKPGRDLRQRATPIRCYPMHSTCRSSDQHVNVVDLGNCSRCNPCVHEAGVPSGPSTRTCTRITARHGCWEKVTLVYQQGHRKAGAITPAAMIIRNVQGPRVWSPPCTTHCLNPYESQANRIFPRHPVLHHAEQHTGREVESHKLQQHPPHSTTYWAGLHHNR